MMWSMHHLKPSIENYINIRFARIRDSFISSHENQYQQLTPHRPWKFPHHVASPELMPISRASCVLRADAAISFSVGVFFMMCSNSPIFITLHYPAKLRIFIPYFSVARKLMSASNDAVDLFRNIMSYNGNTTSSMPTHQWAWCRWLKRASKWRKYFYINYRTYLHQSSYFWHHFGTAPRQACRRWDKLWINEITIDFQDVDDYAMVKYDVSISPALIRFW